MRKAARYLSLFAAGMVPAGCAGAGVAVTPGSPAANVARIERAPAPRATATPLNVAATIASVVASAEKSYGFPGAAVEVYYGGKAYAYYYGVQDRTTRVPVSAQTGFELGSLTKTFSALALELAVQYPSLIDSVNKGTKVTKVSLDDPATKYVYLFPVAHPQTETALGAPCPSSSPEPVVPASKYTATWKAITLQDLADHTSTLPDQPANIFGTGTLPVPDRPCYGAQDLENYVATYNAPAGAKLGSSYLYSDIGYGVLGYALQGIYNVEYYTLMEYLILSKLTMHHTFDVSTAPAGYGANYATPYLSNGTTPTYHWPFDAWPGGGTLRSTGPDMLYYLEAALQISPNAQINAAMKAAQVPIPAVKGGPVQGLAWAQETLDATAGRKPFTVTWKDGATGGMSAWIGVVNPGSKSAFGVVVMVNESDGGAPAPGIATKILEDLAP